MNEFEYLDFILLVSGCKVFCKNACVHMLNMNMLLLILFCYAPRCSRASSNRGVGRHGPAQHDGALLARVLWTVFIGILAFHWNMTR